VKEKKESGGERKMIQSEDVLKLYLRTLERTVLVSSAGIVF